MSAERPILIVDDDEALRETLADQLARRWRVHRGRGGDHRRGGGEAGRQGCAVRRGDSGRRPAGRRRARPVQPAAQAGAEDADHHADRLGRRDRRRARPRFRRQRLHRQAVPADRTAGAAARAAPHLREQRGCGLHHRPLHVPPVGQAAAGAGEEPPHPPDREGGGDPEVPVSRRHARRWRGRCC